MGGYIDLHCHFVPGIDDGARSPEEGKELLEGLHAAGFELVVATPHMRPGMFENTAARITSAYEKMAAFVKDAPAVPKTALSSEHYFSSEVFERLMAGS